MSSVLDPKALAASPLADLHLLANELGVDGYRRLRKADLIDAIIAKQSGEDPPAAAAEPAEETPAAAGEPAGEVTDEVAATSDEEAAPEEEAAPAEGEAADADEDDSGRRRRRGRRGGRSRGRGRDEDTDSETDEEPESEPAGRSERGGRDQVADGIVELVANGSAFLRVAAPDPSDGDVYISAAQVKRCELVSGDRVTGPVRRPRQSEHHPSLVRVDTINGRSADEVVEGTRFEDRPAAFPDERLVLGVEDPTVRAIEWLTPFGRGSRVVICGPARSGKTEALRRVTAALAAQGSTELIVVLAGARPEEVADWKAPGLPEPVAVAALGASSEVQAQAVDQAVEQGRRVAARGGDAVVVVDSLSQLPAGAARRALGTARNLVDGGSLTVLVTANEPLGGETTVVTLDGGLTALHRFPALDLTASGTMRPERLVGDEGAEAIVRARAEALG